MEVQVYYIWILDIDTDSAYQLDEDTLGGSLYVLSGEGIGSYGTDRYVDHYQLGVL